MTRALVFTRSAVSLFRQTSIPAAWLDTLAEDLVDPTLLVRRQDDVVVVASRQQPPDDRLLVLALSERGLFPGWPSVERKGMLDRCLRFATITFEGRSSLPPSWKPYNAGSLVSFYAHFERNAERLVVDRRPVGSEHIYVAESSSRDDVFRLESLSLDYRPFQIALAAWATVRSRLAADAGQHTAGQVDLTAVLPEPVRYELRYEDWLSRLTPQQRLFVDTDVHGPLKLRGAAGSGKTVAMIVKFLREAYLKADAKRHARLLFVTHSWGVAEQADHALSHIDSRGIYRDGSGDIELHVLPLLSIVTSALGYGDTLGLRSLGTDSQEGKVATLRLITRVLDEFITSDWLAFRGAVSEDLRNRIEAPKESPLLRAVQWDLMNEFACVLGAQRIGLGGDTTRREQYLRGKRSAATMRLDSETERRVVLHLYERYLDRLREEGLLSSDQLVNDYLGRLLSFYWDRVRREQGYDIVFVDEMHLFNAQERLIFHQLTRSDVEGPPVVMALDPKQSPRETFVRAPDDGTKPGLDIYTQARLGKPLDIELTSVFRYTNEILAVVRRLDSGFPTLDLGGDWGELAATTGNGPGPKPTLHVYSSRAAQIERAFAMAAALTTNKGNRGGKVAVLTMDPARFDGYSRRSDVGDAFLLVASREDTDSVRYSGRRFVLSQPEYVAGLQFRAVLLIDVNQDLLGGDGDAGYLLRRFCSELYLGITRAERELHVFSSDDAGGPAPMVLRWEAEGLLQRSKVGQ